jgi:hypothetical protein
MATWLHWGVTVLLLNLESLNQKHLSDSSQVNSENIFQRQILINPVMGYLIYKIVCIFMWTRNIMYIVL